MRVGPDAGTVEVFSFKEGMFAAAGHDLRLVAERFEIEVSEDERSVRARIEVGSLRVASAMKGGRELPGALTAKDQAEIDRDLQRAVLESHRYPEVVFESTAIEAGTARGRLTLHGQTREVAFPWGVVGDRRVAEVDLDQRAFGIEPFRAFMGALRIKPVVRVRVTIPARAPGSAG